MFEVSDHTFGKKEALTLSSSATGDAITILPGFGAKIVSFMQKGVRIIDVPSDFTENYCFQSAILSPYPNKIRDGKYAFEGQQYQLTRNDRQRKHAAHGHIYDQSFALDQVQVFTKYAFAELSAVFPGIPGYPFTYALKVKYLLHTASGLHIDFTTKNLSSQVIPYGLGFHPYVIIRDPQAAKLYMPLTAWCLADEENIPNGKLKQWSLFEKGRAMGDTDWNHCFKVSEANKTFVVSWEVAEAYLASLRFETGPKQFGYFQLYKPATASEIAVEPMTCAPNAFNSGAGLIHLGPGEAVTQSLTIALQNT